MKYVRIEGSRKLSLFVEPMKAQLADRPAFDSQDWLFEIKWDGYRAIAEITKSARKLYSMNGLTFDKKFPPVFAALDSIKVDAIIDGEIVVFDAQGKPDFQLVQNYKGSDRYAIQYYVFDCIELKGKSIAHLPLVERKEKLKKVLPDSNVIRYCDHVETQGKELFEKMKEMGLEGMIGKRKDSRYLPGQRSPNWLKFKNVKIGEAVIVGFTVPKKSRKFFGSLVLAVYEKQKLILIGNVGTGFSDESLKDLHGKLSKLVRKTSPLDVPIKEADITWVDPKLVCNIKYTEITADGGVRHPVFNGLRIDKSPLEVHLELPKRVKK
jgi:bifunctional non-homologous end joining protein LigD